MDQQLLIGGSVALLLAIMASFLCLYIVVVLLSPPPIVSVPSEKYYRSALSSKIPIPLPRLVEDSASTDLSVVIPAFNETTRLPSMLSTAIEYLKKRGCTFEVIIIDDGSTDGTTKKALSLAQQYKPFDIRVITLEANLGKGGAVRHGMLHSRGSKLLMVDADGASRFEDLELLWAEMEKVAPNNEPAIVIGSRAHLVKSEAVVKRSVLRNVAMYGLHTVLRIVGVGHIRDTQCGFKLFTRDAARQIFPFQHLSGWIFDVEILLIAKELNIPVSEIPIAWHEVPASKLKLVRDSLSMLSDLLLLRANQFFGRWKAPTKSKVE